ncbi:MAG: hypothetical protein JRG95_12530 [Deltaproteobacteria bacterium]|nr:hypothetical protein [Deltaproteobacteria bacterium]
MEFERQNSSILSQRSARTLTNAADALGIEDPARLAALAEAAESWLRHRGVSAARRAWFQLACLEWRPALTRGPGSSFSRLPRAERIALLEGRKLEVVRALIGASAPDPISPGTGHSSPGA